MIENLTVKKFIEGLRSKEFSVFEVVSAYLKKIKEQDNSLNAFLEVFEEESLKKAHNIDLEISKIDFWDEKMESLLGVPFGIKDNILIKDTKTTAASKILANYKASYDATVIKKLKEEGSIFIGKTNLDEFAMGSSTENSAFKITKNPFDGERVPGGSSGGSAAAVAKNEVLAALGSDTGGSIRQPAAFCGVVGLKPTYGTVSRYGLIAMASSLDQIGPITKTVEDAEIVFQKICGKDEKDSTSADYEYKPFPIEETKKFKIGLPKEYFAQGLNKEIEEGIEFAVNKFKKLGLEFKEISLPHTKYALSVYYIIMPAEVSANLARFDGVRYGRNVDTSNLKDLYFKNRGEGFGREVRRRILLGTFVLSKGYYDAYYSKAQKVRSLIRKDFEEAFKEVDIILSPVTPTLPFKIGEKIENPLEMYLSDMFTIPVNLAGIPALSLPTGLYKNNLPVGFQLIGKHFEENKILALGKLYESSF
jgi:aspartyl-tRNA(Asn)/glutamyl-tRNA(Gln) amidotransferase subunit A